MNIILEGPDGSGKSSLAKYLSSKTGWPINRGQGPCHSQADYDARAKVCFALNNTIFDRHFIVSESLYGRFRTDHPSYVRFDIEKEFYLQPNFIIYCTPTLNHRLNWKDTPQHLHLLKLHGDDIRSLYDQWAADHCDLHYRRTDQMNRVLRVVSGLLQQPLFDPVADVDQFHVKHQIDYTGKPRALPFELQQFRLKFLREETQEYETHADQAAFEAGGPGGEIDHANLTHHLAESLDALADLTYVVLGTAHLHGFDFREAWRRVHAANMKKVASVEPGDANSKFKLKITKPKGWEPPRHEDLVEDNAHHE